MLRFYTRFEGPAVHATNDLRVAMLASSCIDHMRLESDRCLSAADNMASTGAAWTVRLRGCGSFAFSTSSFPVPCAEAAERLSSLWRTSAWDRARSTTPRRVESSGQARSRPARDDAFRYDPCQCHSPFGSTRAAPLATAHSMSRYAGSALPGSW